MGLTFIEGLVTGPSGKQARVNFLVDSGATYTLLPDSVWRELELHPKRQMTFTLADGTAIVRPIAEAHIALAGMDGTSPVILGEPGDEALLGSVTLEVLGLVLDPFKRSLQPMRATLA
ncbi:MAG: aspartyl protease family protein [Anaerolineae bacterium]|nr:aspartyl protease family protein [Anaerolineae bacterium]